MAQRGESGGTDLFQFSLHRLDAGMSESATNRLGDVEMDSGPDQVSKVVDEGTARVLAAAAAAVAEAGRKAAGKRNDVSLRVAILDKIPDFVPDGNLDVDAFALMGSREES